MLRPAGRSIDEERAVLDENEPVTLREACRLFFGNRISPSALRTEAAKGNLVITQIARKDFVTRRDIEEMKQRCRRPAKTTLLDDNRVQKTYPGAATLEPPLSSQEILRIRLQKRMKEDDKSASRRGRA
ncbi:MAG: hypothetical protein EPN45_00630 [Rhizobiaceae bacterium]|nr:MAG: hypothetical protein EPN45_00630 [Rhizobiaceae bacterium]